MARSSIAEMNTVYTNLSFPPNLIADAPSTPPPAYCWRSMMAWLFGPLPLLGPVDHEGAIPLAVSDEEERIVDSLLGAAGAFLMTQSRTLTDRVDLWQAEVLAQMRDKVSEANAAGIRLLLQVGEGTWREALNAAPTSSPS